MTKKEQKRIEEIFNNRFKTLTECAGELALEKLHVNDKEFYDKEIQEIDNLMNIMFYLKQEILGE